MSLLAHDWDDEYCITTDVCSLLRITLHMFGYGDGYGDGGGGEHGQPRVAISLLANHRQWRDRSIDLSVRQDTLLRAHTAVGISGTVSSTGSSNSRAWQEKQQWRKTHIHGDILPHRSKVAVV